MNVTEFGRALVVTGDLDPIYLMLNASSMDPDTTARWCLAYWCYYHAGVASRIAEQRDRAFWATMWTAYTDKWPRGTERRHFRGNACQAALNDLQRRFPQPEDAAASLAGYASWKALVASDVIPPVSFARVANCAQSWVGFGPWIAFKVADMLDAVIGIQVQFPQDSSVWFDEPIKGGVWAVLEDDGSDLGKREEFFVTLTPGERHAMADAAIEMLMPKFRGLKGPDGRAVRIQELETILCKWKSHVNGRYPVGKDTREILHGLDGWGGLAQQLQRALRDVTPREHHDHGAILIED